MFDCLTIICSTVPPLDVLLFHNLSSTVPPSYLPLFHHEMFHCSTIISSTFPPSNVLLSYHQMFYFSTTRCSNVPPSVFHCFTISVSLFLHQMVHCSTIFFASFFLIGVLTLRGLTTSGSYNQGFLQPGVLHAGVLTTRGSYYKGSYNQRFFHPGVLQPAVRTSRGPTTRALYI